MSPIAFWIRMWLGFMCWAAASAFASLGWEEGDWTRYVMATVWATVAVFIAPLNRIRIDLEDRP